MKQNEDRSTGRIIATIPTWSYLGNRATTGSARVCHDSPTKLFDILFHLITYRAGDTVAAKCMWSCGVAMIRFLCDWECMVSAIDVNFDFIRVYICGNGY